MEDEEVHVIHQQEQYDKGTLNDHINISTTENERGQTKHPEPAEEQTDNNTNAQHRNTEQLLLKQLIHLWCNVLRV